MLKAAGSITNLPGLGNARSFRFALAWVLDQSWRPSDVVFFLEDDYLALPSMLIAVKEALATPGFDYVTPYDHPDRYTRLDDWPRPKSERTPVERRIGSRCWKPVESTTMTFAACWSVVRKDSLIHRMLSLGGAPRDRAIWRCIQRLGPLRIAPWGRHQLWGPTPALATHVEQGYVASGVDWTNINDAAL